MSIIRRCCITAVICFIAAFASAGQDEDSQLFYIINYTVSHCNAEIELNGVPLTRTEKEHQYSTTGLADANRWILPGVNTVTVTIRPAEGKPDPDTRPSLTVTMSTAKRGQMSDEGTVIAKLELPKSESDRTLDAVTKPFTRELRFTPAHVPPSELWARIKPEKLDAAAKQEILGLVRDYHAALSKKDTAATEGFFLYAAVESARIRYQSVNEVKTALQKELKKMLATKGFSMVPLDTDRLVFRPVAGGRIVWVTDPAGEAPLRTKELAEGGTMEFPVYVARVEGKWTIVR
jgi:hypothetical protein